MHAHDARGFNFDNKFFHFVGDAGSGSIHGNGTLFFSDGGSLEGDFECGELNGEGVRRWLDGSVYVGEFKRGEPHGRGRLVKLDGSEYEGEFSYGQYGGSGELEDRTEHTHYKGQFNRHRFHGEGVFVTKSVTWRGPFSEGLPHGAHLVAQYQNGDRAEGSVSHGKFHGEKIQYELRADGTSYEGPMQDGHRTEFPSVLLFKDVRAEAPPESPRARQPSAGKEREKEKELPPSKLKSAVMLSARGSAGRRRFESIVSIISQGQGSPTSPRTPMCEGEEDSLLPLMKAPDGAYMMTQHRQLILRFALEREETVEVKVPQQKSTRTLAAPAGPKGKSSAAAGGLLGAPQLAPIAGSVRMITTTIKEHRPCSSESGRLVKLQLLKAKIAEDGKTLVGDPSQPLPIALDSTPSDLQRLILRLRTPTSSPGNASLFPPGKGHSKQQKKHHKPTSHEESSERLQRNLLTNLPHCFELEAYTDHDHVSFDLLPALVEPMDVVIRAEACFATRNGEFVSAAEAEPTDIHLSSAGGQRSPRGLNTARSVSSLVGRRPSSSTAASRRSTSTSQADSNGEGASRTPPLAFRLSPGDPSALHEVPKEECCFVATVPLHIVRQC